MSNGASRKKGVIVSAAYIVGQIAVNLVYVPLLLTTIGQDEYGLYQLVGSIVSYIAALNGVLAAGVGRFYSKYKAEEDAGGMDATIATANVVYNIVGLIAIAVSILFIPMVRTAYSSSLDQAQLAEMGGMLVILALNTVVSLKNTITTAVLQANEEFLFWKGSRLAFLMIQPVFVLGAVALLPNALMVTIVIFVNNIICSLAQRSYCMVRMGLSYRGGKFEKRLAKSISMFSLSVLLVTIADQIFWTADKMLVAYFYGTGVTAIYSIGAQIYSSYMYTGQIVPGVFFQKVSELYHQKKDLEAISALFARVGRLTSILCLAVLLGFMCLGSDFIRIWAGDGYEEAYAVAIIVMVPFTIDLVQNLGITILQVMDKYLFRGVMYLFLSLVNIVMTLVLLKEYGIAGAATATGISMFIGNGIVMNIYYSKVVGLNIRLFWKQVAGLSMPLLIYGAVVIVFKRVFELSVSSWFELIAYGCVFLAGFCMVLYRYSLNSDERNLIFGKVQNAVRWKEKDRRN